MRKIIPMNIFAKLMIASVFCSSTAKLYEVHATEVVKNTNQQQVALRTLRTSSLYYVGDEPANGWVFHEQPVDGYYYLFYKDGVRLTGMGTDADGEHLFIDGLLAQGMHNYNGVDLLYENGNPVTGYRDGIYYVSGYIANGWIFHKEPIDGKYYLFYKDGERLTGMGTDGNGEHLFINGLLAQGLQTFAGQERIYKDGNYANGWVNGIYAINGYYAHGWVVHNPPVDGQYYLFYKYGVRLTGKGTDGNGEHLFINGLLAQGLQEYAGGKRCYVDGNLANGWIFHKEPIDGKYYLFYKDGERLTGMGTDGNGEHLFINGLLAQGLQTFAGQERIYKDGNYANGWVNGIYAINGYYAHGWVVHNPPVDGQYYLFYKYGVRLTGKGTDGNGEHLFINGLLAQGLQEYAGGKRCYVDGNLANGWIFHKEPIDGKYYLFYKDGERLTGMGTDGNGEHLFINGLLAQGLQTFAGQERIYKDGNYANGWVNGIYAINGYYAHGWVVHNPPVDGQYYLFYKYGVRLTGKGTDGNGEHLFINGLLAQGLQEYAGGKRCYVDGNLANGWIFHKEPIDGKYYLFYKDGERLTGMGTDGNGEHLFINGLLAQGYNYYNGQYCFYRDGNVVNTYNDKYYVNGSVANGWIFHKEPIDGKYYLFYKDGERLTGMGTDGNGEHLFINGLLAQGMQNYPNAYRLYEDGNLVTGFRKNKYYLNGSAANGWVVHKPPVDGYYYLFYKDGERLTGMGTDGNGEHLFINGLLAQGLQTFAGQERIYKDGNYANGWVNGIYAINGYYANGWVKTDSGEEIYFIYGKNASPKTLRENYTNEEFIQVIAYYVRKYSAQYGIKVNSGIIAQAILESNWGRSSLSAKYHNYFGLKAGPYWKGKSVNMATQEEYVPGTYTNVRDNFRVYNSIEEGVRGYFEFTKFPNYAKIKTATTPEEYLTYIKQAGYATSSTYVQNTLRVVNTYNLTKYD